MPSMRLTARQCSASATVRAAGWQQQEAAGEEGSSKEQQNRQSPHPAAARHAPPAARREQFAECRKDLEKAVEVTREKVQLAANAENLIARIMKKLDSEIQKFTRELESSNPGITATLEEKSIRLDADRPPPQPTPIPTPQVAHYEREDSHKRARYDSSRAEAADVEVPTPKRQRSTQKKKQQQTQLQQGQQGQIHAHAQQHQLLYQTAPPVAPEEPRYCICNQYSYGEMVGCDNDNCPIEWFHYGCVGITEPPKGKWYCPRCR
eukprot:m.119760 g.119760  ORF g.119760 m.119760 type:complete len:264 (+) comp9563_c1_seq3:3520-4311(+)